VAGVAELSDVALLNRLRASSDWLGHLLTVKLAEVAPPPPSAGKPIRLIDATTISRPGSTGTDWRVHLGFDLPRLAIDRIELTDGTGGESLRRLPMSPGDVLIGDRGYAQRPGFHVVKAAGADFIVRLNWQNVPLQSAQGREFDLLAALRQLPDVEAQEHLVRVAPSRRDRLRALPARLVAARKTEVAAEDARARAMRESSRKGRPISPHTLEAAGYVFVLTSLSPQELSASEVLDLYRFRWQIELAFKRLKSLLYLDELPARDPPLARSFLLAKLLAAVLLEELTTAFLAFSPWGYRLVRTPAVPVEDPARSS
jgi:hypothetical protein